MRERTGLERELGALFGESEEQQFELKGTWATEEKWEKVELTDPDQDEPGASIKVLAFRFKGSSQEVALVFSGVHGTEHQGVEAANQLLGLLKEAARNGKKPKFTTVVIPELIAPGRRTPSNPRLAKDAKGKFVEPNRNFPLPGESYNDALARAKNRSDKAELLCPKIGKNEALRAECKEDSPLNVIELTPRMLAETRILVQLIERHKPVRAVSIHAHSVPGSRGDGPGLFVDPRGGFNKLTDKAETPASVQDDILTRDLLAAAILKINPKLSDILKRGLAHPFHGNLVPKTGGKADLDLAKATVHYTSTKHLPGTSFGGWAPQSSRDCSRKGITTVTVELPQYAAPLLGKADLKEPVKLAVKLKSGNDPLSLHLQKQFPNATQSKLKAYDGSSPLSANIQIALIDGLNAQIKGPSLFDAARFSKVKLAEETISWSKQKPTGDEGIRLNRFLLEEAYPEIAKSPIGEVNSAHVSALLEKFLELTP